MKDFNLGSSETFLDTVILMPLNSWPLRTLCKLWLLLGELLPDRRLVLPSTPLTHGARLSVLYSRMFSAFVVNLISAPSQYVSMCHTFCIVLCYELVIIPYTSMGKKDAISDIFFCSMSISLQFFLPYCYATNIIQ